MSIDKKIWNSYANWAEVAQTESTEQVKDTITGLKGIWKPNPLSSNLASAMKHIAEVNVAKYGAQTTVIDFGCGLGRNAPFLRQFFPRVIGLDIPEMVQRLKAEHPLDLGLLYDAVYDNLEDMAHKEAVHALYDSVVFQHFIDQSYMKTLTTELLSIASLNTIISLWNVPWSSPFILELLMNEHNWVNIFSEIDQETFNDPHQLNILRRPE